MAARTQQQMKDFDTKAEEWQEEMVGLFRLVSFTAGVNTSYRPSEGYSGFLWFGQSHDNVNLLKRLLFASIPS